MKFNRINEGKVKIDDNVMEKMKENLRKSIDNQKEYCGILLGREIIDTSNIIIDKITEPSKEDIQSKYYFFRDYKFHQKQIEEEWLLSKGTCNYLGEWHTHLEEAPIPSCKDKKEWKRALKNFKFDGNFLFFIIVGIGKISIWEGNRKTLEILKLYEVENDIKI